MQVTKKEGELYESKRLNNMKASNASFEAQSNTRQTKDIISNLHLTIKQSDEALFKVQNELRNKEDSYKRTITKLERQISELNEELSKKSNKHDLDKTLHY